MKIISPRYIKYMRKKYTQVMTTISLVVNSNVHTTWYFNIIDYQIVATYIRVRKSTSTKCLLTQ